MKNNHGLKYCYDCKNKGFSVSKGVYCSLTNGYPVFINECENYIFDSIERDRLKEERRKHVKINGIKKNIDTVRSIFRLNKSLIRETRKYDDAKYKHWQDLPNEIVFTKKYRLPIISDFTVFIFVILILYLSGLLSSNPNFVNYYIPIAVGVIILRLAYFYFMTKRNQTIIKLDDTGIEHYKKGKFSWQEILLTLIKTKRGFGNVSYDYLVISLITSFNQITIPLGLNLNNKEIENCIELYKDKYDNMKQQRHNNGYSACLK